MKTTQSLLQKGKGFSFLMALLFACSLASAQTPPTMYMGVRFYKVAPENVSEFEKMMGETWKPVNQLRKQNGSIFNWSLFRVQFKGANDEFNYATVTYFDSFAKTEDNVKWAELLKAVNPKADADAIIARWQKVATTVKQYLYVLSETAVPKTPVPYKYAIVSYMKTKPGMANEYNKILKEDWKPVHQTMIDAGQMARWNVWTLMVPAGSEINHDLFTSNLFATYDQALMAGYADAFKKVGKDSQTVLDKSNKTRDTVRRELLELVMGLN